MLYQNHFRRNQIQIRIVDFPFRLFWPRQVKFAKRLLKNEVKLRWSVWPQWMHGLCRLWKQTSPRRIPWDTLSPDEHTNFHSERFQSRWYVCGFHDLISQSCWKMRFFVHLGKCIEGQRIFQPIFKTLNRFRKALGIGVDHIEWRCGSNENANRLIRRWFPKGTDFSKVTAAQIAALQDWINNYPHKVLNWSTSNTVYELYMQQE